jgi:hypothetical protein
MSLLGLTALAITGLALPPQEFSNQAGMVFPARVTDAEQRSSSTRVTLEIRTTWKGEVIRSAVVRSESSDECSIPFHAGMTTVVFARLVGGDLIAIPCGGTGAYQRADAVAQLTFIPVVFACSSALLACAGLLVARARTGSG